MKWLRNLVRSAKTHQKFKQDWPINTPKRGANAAKSLFSDTTAGIGLGQSFQLTCVCFQHSMFVDLAESSNLCQPSWYLIASAAGMLQSVRSSWMYWRDSMPYSHPCHPLSCRDAQCYLASQSCHTFRFSRAYNVGSLTGIPKSALGA